MLRKRPMKTSMVLAHSVTGQYLDTLGVLILGMRLGKELLEHDFQVVRGVHHPIILGWDFLQKHHALIDVTNQKLSLWNVELPLLSSGHEAAACCNVSVLASTKLPAWSEMIITACMAGTTAVSPVPTDYTGVLEPKPASNSWSPWKSCLMYLDDVLIFSQTFEDHLQNLEEIFSRFKSCGLKLNPSKCSLAKSEV